MFSGKSTNFGRTFFSTCLNELRHDCIHQTIDITVILSDGTSSKFKVN